jgi:hypothetical protein
VAIVSALLGALLVAGALPWPRRWRDEEPEDAPPEARGGRGALGMAAWVLLPAVGFYVQSFVRPGGHDVWNARYLGIVWPAVAVLAALALQRLPLPWLRAGGIALLLGVNLVQYGLRLGLESGVPVDLIARDVATAKNSEGGVRTVVAVGNDPDRPSLGGNGGIFDFPGKYYLSLALDKQYPPQRLRSEPAQKLFHLETGPANTPATVGRLIVWTDGPPARRDADDPVLKSLGPGWSRALAREHAVRDFWCWRRMFRCTRSVYVRSEVTGTNGTTEQPMSRKKSPKRRR